MKDFLKRRPLTLFFSLLALLLVLIIIGSFIRKSTVKPSTPVTPGPKKGLGV